METHGNPTMEELKEMYPPNTYYICALNVHNDTLTSIGKLRKTGKSKFLGIQNSHVIYGKENEGCLYYHGHWAIPCDEYGTPLNTPSKDVSNYEIF